MRRTGENHGESTRSRSQAGAGRPCVAASKRGVRHASASTMKETVSAAVAPAMASSGEIGRFFDPPTPCAEICPARLRTIAQETSSWTMIFSRVCDSTSTMPGWSIPTMVRVVVPASYSSSCSGVECTWISPGASAVTLRVMSWPVFTLTRSPLGVTVSPAKVTSMTGLSAACELDSLADGLLAAGLLADGLAVVLSGSSEPQPAEAETDDEQGAGEDASGCGHGDGPFVGEEERCHATSNQVRKWGTRRGSNRSMTGLLLRCVS